MKKYWEPLKRFIKFNIVGIMNTLLDLALFALFTRVVGFGEGLSKTISYSCGVLNSYIWNSRWTFKREHQNTKKEFILFIVVNLISYGVARAVLLLSQSWLGIEDGLIRNLIATPASIIVNFAGNRLFVFRSEDKQQDKKT